MVSSPQNAEAALPLQSASGRVLVTGGGLGLDVDILLDNPNVGSITVLEIDPELCNALSELYPSVDVLCQDANSFSETNFDFVWIDHFGEYSEQTCQEQAEQVARYRALMPDALIVGSFEAWQ